MLTLTTTQNTQPDYVALAMVLALAVIVVIMVIRKRSSGRKQEAAPVAASPVEPQQTVSAPGSAGHVRLHSVEPKTAAMLMAIVADKMQKPLNELRFISIKEVE